MRKNRLLAALLAVLVLLGQWCFAEQEYVNLDERFSNQSTYQYDGETYYLKDRVKTTLVLCANVPDDPQAGAGSLELMVILPVDDDKKFITPVQFSPDMLLSWLEGDDQAKTLGQLFEETETPQAGCEQLVAALNALFPAEVIGQYAMLDLRGLSVLDGIANDETNTTGEALVERLRTIKREVEQGGDNINTMISELSGYIVTDMNSGAMMKVADKADRYDRSHRTPFPVVESGEEAETDQPLIPDLEAFESMMLEIYYKDNGIW